MLDFDYYYVLAIFQYYIYISCFHITHNSIIIFYYILFDSLTSLKIQGDERRDMDLKNSIEVSMTFGTDVSPTAQ